MYQEEKTHINEIYKEFKKYIEKFKGINGIGMHNNEFIVYANRHNYRKLNKKIPKVFNGIDVYVYVVINSWLL